MHDADTSREVAEQAREAEWKGDSFLRELFLGRCRLALLESLPLSDSTRPEFVEFYRSMARFLCERVDPDEIDARGEYPEQVIRGLAALGAFGMTIPKQYGGLGLSHREYMQVMQLLGSHDANVTALLSAHQAIGVPQPVMMFGTEEQKRRFLPRCARGAISAFALTEPAVGSDPARLSTTAKASSDGQMFTIDGQKLWCTNGTLAELIVVMARNPDTQRINAFVVEMDTAGITVEHRCRFMGLRALGNAVLHFDAVRVPRENLLGEEGSGLKIALSTLNTGRLSLPAAMAGIGKQCTEVVRKWSNAREQWGRPIGEHEAVASMNASIAACTFAMDSLSRVVGALSDQADVDIRLEAAAAKEWNTVGAWRVLDTALQVRGGRGYETAGSLAARGEAKLSIERPMRDARVNLIFEGSSEIMHLFMAREAVDKHLQVAQVLVDSKATLGQRLRALPRIAAFYALWYPTRYVGWGWWPRFSRYGELATHVRFASRAGRRLARALFHGMLRHRAALELRQRFLFRLVDIALDVFALLATVVRAHHLTHPLAQSLEQQRTPNSVVELTQLVAAQLRRRIDNNFASLFHNDDRLAARAGRSLLRGHYRWLEQGSIGVPYEAADLRPPSMDELMQARRKAPLQSGPAPRDHALTSRTTETVDSSRRG